MRLRRIGLGTVSSSAPTTIDDVVDFQLAASVATRTVGGGPRIALPEAKAAVAQLSELASESVVHVGAATGQTSKTLPRVEVVDRPKWVLANTTSMRQLLRGGVERALSAREKPITPATARTGAALAGMELGGVLGFLSARVLGQFDPHDDVGGTLYLVAPNIVKVEKELGVDPTDFRYWVCLHEETHRWQFEQAPWLAEHIRDQASELICSTLDGSRTLSQSVSLFARKLPDVLRQGGHGLGELVLNDEQRQRVEETGAMMALLEGHADVIMDRAAEGVIGDVEDLRKRFTQYRKGRSPLDVLTRRALGFEAKMSQYSVGADFVKEVVSQVGMARFNHVFAGPENLPTAAEIRHPAQWIERVVSASTSAP